MHYFPKLIFSGNHELNNAVKSWYDWKFIRHIFVFLITKGYRNKLRARLHIIVENLCWCYNGPCLWYPRILRHHLQPLKVKLVEWGSVFKARQFFVDSIFEHFGYVSLFIFSYTIYHLKHDCYHVGMNNTKENPSIVLRLWFLDKQGVTLFGFFANPLIWNYLDNEWWQFFCKYRLHFVWVINQWQR